jgi:hypothetical protein
LSSLALQDEDPTITAFEPDNSRNSSIREVDSYPVKSTNNIHLVRHQMCAITPTGSKEFYSSGNPIANPTDLTRGAGHRAPPEGSEESRADDTRIEAQPRIQISQAEWYKERDVVSGAALMPTDANRNELMAYQYLLNHHRRQLSHLRQQIDVRWVAAYASSQH